MSLLNELRAEKAKLEKRLDWINQGLSELGREVRQSHPVYAVKVKKQKKKGHHKDKHKMSQATREKLSKAAKERWAKVKGQ